MYAPCREYNQCVQVLPSASIEKSPPWCQAGKVYICTVLLKLHLRPTLEGGGEGRSDPAHFLPSQRERWRKGEIETVQESGWIRRLGTRGAARDESTRSGERESNSCDLWWRKTKAAACLQHVEHTWTGRSHWSSLSFNFEEMHVMIFT